MRLLKPSSVTPAKQALLDLLQNHTPAELAKALRSAHNTVLYHSEIILGQEERLELLYIKLLADAIEEVGKEGE